MNTKRSDVTVSIAQTQQEINQALAFCGSVYERSYGTYWKVPPDLFFVAREQGEIIATGGLTFAAQHAEIASERYFRLTEDMRGFIATNRERIVEFGRFASIKIRGAKAIMHSALSYCMLAEIDFLLAWANAAVSKHTSRLGLNLWPITVPLNLDNAISDSRWASPPTGFFVREQPPALHLVIVPFCENVTRTLAEECGIGTAAPSWRTGMTDRVSVVPMQPTSVAHSAPRLMRAGSPVDMPGQARLETLPEFGSRMEPDGASPPVKE